MKKFILKNKFLTFIKYIVNNTQLLLTIFLMVCYVHFNQAFAGAFVFAGDDNGVDIITHPSGYNGTGGEITIGVCIDSSSANASDMVIPIQNMVDTFTKRQVHIPNLFLGAANSVPSSTIDFESVALHELGHCLSLAHPNIGGSTSSASNYTITTKGADNIFNQDSGVDLVIGSNDDMRGDDVNLHWFNKNTNNPCAIDSAVIDASTFSRAVADLPNTDSFPANADRDVCANLGINDAEAVMQQLSFTDEEQRRLSQDDVSTLKLGMSGLDEIANTADDYTIKVESLGVVVDPENNSNCDVIADFDNTRTGFALCSFGGAFLGGNHIAITTASMFFNSGVNWHFNTVLDRDIFCGGGPLVSDTDINLSNQTIIDERRYQATQGIVGGTNLEVSSSGCLGLTASTKVILEPGFSVKNGGLFKALIE